MRNLLKCNSSFDFLLHMQQTAAAVGSNDFLLAKCTNRYYW